MSRTPVAPPALASSTKDNTCRRMWAVISQMPERFSFSSAELTMITVWEGESHGELCWRTDATNPWDCQHVEAIKGSLETPLRPVFNPSLPLPPLWLKNRLKPVSLYNSTLLLSKIIPNLQPEVETQLAESFKKTDSSLGGKISQSTHVAWRTKWFMLR